MRIDKKKIKVNELKSICKGLGISCKGTKSELVERLDQFNTLINDTERNNFNDLSFNTVSRAEFSEEFQEEKTEDLLEENKIKLLESNILIDEQNKEFEQSLKNDQTNQALKKLELGNFESISSQELDLLAEKLNICFINNPIESYKLQTILKLNDKSIVLEDNKNSEMQDLIEEDTQLTKQELLNTRLKYFS